jgi:hypothetical protein
MHAANETVRCSSYPSGRVSNLTPHIACYSIVAYILQVYDETISVEKPSSTIGQAMQMV